MEIEHYQNATTLFAFIWQNKKLLDIGCVSLVDGDWSESYPVVEVETNISSDIKWFDIKVEAENPPCNDVKSSVIWQWEV